MPPSASTDLGPDRLLPILNIAAFERAADGSFELIGEAPDWVRTLWPAVEKHVGIALGDASPFLRHFLDEAEVYWHERDEAPLRSEPWSVTTEAGDEYILEAAALHLDGHDLLLVTFHSTDFNTLKDLLQKSREQNLNYQQLIKEIDKREVLLHCIVHDLSNPLAAIRGSLFLMQQDGIVRDEGSELLGVALHQVEKMQLLIREILSSFAQEVKPLLPTTEVDHEAAVDVAACARSVVAAMTAAAQLKSISLDLDIEDSERTCWRARGEAHRLERVLFNLIENALRHSPESGTVRVRLRDEGEAIYVTVENQGDPVPEAQVPHLFQKFTQGAGNTGKAGLGLYSSRLIVEHWGGTIGYDEVPEGASFWFCLPKLNP